MCNNNNITVKPFKIKPYKISFWISTWESCGNGIGMGIEIFGTDGLDKQVISRTPGLVYKESGPRGICHFY